MRFSQSTHLLMCLFFETLMSITRTGLPILVALIHPVHYISNNLLQMVNFPTRIPDWDSHSPDLLDLFISSDASICFKMAFHRLGNFDHVVVSVSIDFPSYSQWDPHFIALLMTILLLIRMVCMIIWEMFHGRISVNSVLLLLLVNFVIGFRLELMYISLIESIKRHSSPWFSAACAAANSS